jgi:hypothetical protein
MIKMEIDLPTKNISNVINGKNLIFITKTIHQSFHFKGLLLKGIFVYYSSFNLGVLAFASKNQIIIFN